MKIKPRFIIGLGNPGPRYDLTYHNVGQLFVSWLMKHGTWNIKHKLFMASQFKIHDSRFMIYVVKPLTFMNESGQAVLAAMKYFSAAGGKIKPEEILVIHDDSDIKLGEMKLSFGRGAAGHKGVQSIIDELKTSVKDGSAAGGKNFWRLRIGIRKIAKQTRNPEGKQASYEAGLTQNRREKAGGFVLKKITPADKLILEQVFKIYLPF